MKHLLFAVILATIMVFPGIALDKDSAVQRIAVYPGVGVMIEPGAMGTSLDAQALFDFDNPGKKINFFLGTRAYYGKTERTAYTDQDIYGSLGAGLRLLFFKNKGPESTSLGFRLGMDLGGGYSNHELSSGTMTGYFSFLWEPNAKIEYQIKDASFCFSGGYRGIVSPTGGWVFKKNAVVFSFGYFYHL